MTARRLRLYTDAGLVKDSPSPHAGVYAWCVVEETEDGDQVIAEGEGDFFPADVGASVVISNVAELYAICQGMIATCKRPETQGARLLITSDNKCALGWYECFPRQGKYSHEMYAMLVQARQAEACAKLDHRTLRRVKGHPSPLDLERGYMIHKGVNKPVDEYNHRCHLICDRRCTALAAKLFPPEPEPLPQLLPRRAPAIVPELARCTTQVMQKSIYDILTGESNDENAE